MEFFSGSEFQDAFEESKKPILKNQKIVEKPAESDSEPSCDNFDEEELAERFEAAVTDGDDFELPVKPIKKNP